MSTILKLDTNALERLMKEDDGSIKLELQQSVIEEFGRRHIKAFINDGAFGNQIKQIKNEAIKEIELMIGTWKDSYSTKSNFELHPTIRNMITLQAKSAVTYELDKVEEHVQSLYEQTSNRIKLEYEDRTKKIEGDLKNYLTHLEDEAEKIKSKLITAEVDNILRNHIKSILAESFGVGIK